jgi:hypothetical protein
MQTHRVFQTGRIRGGASARKILTRVLKEFEHFMRRTNLREKSDRLSIFLMEKIK